VNKRANLAIQLRYQGKTAEEIQGEVADKNGRPAIGTINNWFAIGGRLHDAYLQYEDEENERRKKEAYNIYRRNVRAAVGQVLTIMAEGETDQVKLAAARDILDRLFGKASEKIDLNANVYTKIDEKIKKIIDEGE